MKSRWRLALFLALLLCVLYTQSGRRSFPVQTRKLADGSTLRLVNVTHGSHHHHLEGSPLEQWIYPLLPPFLKRLSDDRWGEIDTPAEVPVAWILYTPPPGGSTASPFGNDHWTLFDEHGCEVILGPRTWPLSYFGPPNQRRLMPMPLTPFTHGSKRLSLRYWLTRVNAPAVPSAEFQVLEREAVRTEAPAPEALPATRTFHDLSVTLAKLENGVDMYSDSTLSKRIPMASPSETLIRPLVRLERSGKPAEDWEACGARFTDSSGNVMDPRPHVVAEKLAKGTEMRIFGSLWAHDPAHEVEIEVCRTRASTFTAGELHTIEAPVPDQGARPGMFAQPRRFQISGKTVEVWDPIWDEAPRVLTLPFTIHKQPAPGLRAVIVKVVDERGRVLTRSGQWPTDRYVHFAQPGVESTQIQAMLPTPGPAKKLTVTFAFTQPECVRFRMKPTQWKPPK